MNKETMTVYVTKHIATKGIYKDEVIQIGDDLFKSIKFRHTRYRSNDFDTNTSKVLAMLEAEHHKSQST